MPSVFQLFGELKADTRQFESALKGAESRLRATESAVNSTEKAVSGIGKSSATTARSFEKLNERLGASRARLQAAADAFRNGAISSQKMVSVLNQTENAIAGVNSRLKDQSARFVDASQKKTSFIAKLGAVISVADLTARAIAGISSKLQEGAIALFNYSARMEQTKIAFSTLIGNAQLAQKHIQDLQRFAISTPFEFEGLAKMSQRLQGAGVETAKILPLMKDLGNIAAATGDISSERLEGITTAMSQVISKTKVSAEEMEQLAERGVPAWKILSEATGKSQQELRKLSEQGKISSDVLIAALQKISREKFGDAMEKQSRTFNGAMSNIKDIILQSASTAFQPLFDKISSVAVRFSEEIQSKGGDFEAIGALIAQYLGEGLANAVPTIAETAGKSFANVFSKTVKGEWSGVGFLGVDFLRGQFDAITGGKVFSKSPEIIKTGMVDLAKKLNAELDKTAKKTKDLVAIDEQLKVDKAIAKMKALNEQWRFASDLTKNLSLQVRFFGDETEEASVKQQLLSKGITDFTQGWAKFAVEAAKSLDVLKAQKKAQDEYNDKLKNAREELTKIREQAQFDLRFPKASELDKFNEQIKKGAFNFRGLTEEILLTRQALQNLERFSGAATRSDAYKSLSQTIKSIQAEMSGGFSFNDQFDGQVENFLRPFGLDEKTQDLIVTAMRHRIEQLREQLNKARNAAEIDAVMSFNKDLAQNFFQQFKSDKGVQIFTDDTDSIQKFIELWNVLSAKIKQDSAGNISQIMQNLGVSVRSLSGDFLGAVTPIDTLTKQLDSNASGLQSIAEKAGISSEKLRQLILDAANPAWQKAQESLSAYVDAMARLEDVSAMERHAAEIAALEQVNSLYDAQLQKIIEINTTLGDKIRLATAQTESFTTFWENSAMQSMGRISDIFGSAISNQEKSLAGFFKSVASGFSNMANQIIADLIRLAVYKALLNLFGSLASSGLGSMGSHGGADIGGGGFGGHDMGGLGGRTSAMATQAAMSSVTNNNRSNTYNLSVNFSGNQSPQDRNSMRQGAQVLVAQLQKLQMQNG